MGGDQVIPKRYPPPQAVKDNEALVKFSLSNVAPHDLNGISLAMDKEFEKIKRNAKATKNDDAPVPEYIWNEAIVPDGDLVKTSALDKIREFSLRWWKKHTTRDFLTWSVLEMAK